MKFLVPIDLVQNELQNAVIQNLATAPTSGKAGQLYFNTTDKLLYQYDGTVWKAVGGVYELPVATADTLGGVKVGGGLQITDTGVLSATGGGVADSVEWSGVLDTPTTLEGYGIVDAKIENGTITLGTETITPITSVNGKTGSSVTLNASDVGAQAEDFIIGVNLNLEDGTWSADKTSQEIKNAYNNGKNLKLKISGYIIAYYGSFSNDIMFFNEFNVISTDSVAVIASYALDLSDTVVTVEKIDTGKLLGIGATTLNDIDKAQFRANIGAGTSDFSGSYNDLTDQPTIDTTLSATSTNAVENKAITTELNKKYDSTNQPPYPVTSVDGSTGAVVLNDVKYTEQTLTEAQKTQARANIGAGTSSFSGSYNDLTNKPTVDTAMSADSTNAVQNKVIKAYVDGIVAASQGIVYKGVINSTADIPTTYNVGDLYMIATAGTYVGQVCEVGDLMIAVVGRKGTGNENSDWDVIQTNIEGAITELTGDSPISVTGTGASREIALENSGVTTGGYGDIEAQTPEFGGTFKVPSFTVDQYGRLTAAGEHTITIPATVATDTEDGLMSSSDHGQFTKTLANVESLQQQIAIIDALVTKQFNGTIAEGETSVQIPLSGLTEDIIYSVTAYERANNDAVVVDWKKTATSVVASIASANTSPITVTVIAR